MNKGTFIISLDYESNWGVHDTLSFNEYKENLKKVPTVIDRLLQLSDEFNIKLTFAIVGALFAKDKKELHKYIPKQSPSYKNKNLDPFTSISEIGDTEGTDPYHFANSIIVKIKNYSQHEIGTHTFGHYNCSARGQNVGQFKCDLEAAIDIAKLNQIELSSIVFPKNQIVKEYLDILSSKQIQIYRGTEKSRLYNRSDVNINGSLRLLGVRILRFLDGYMNLSGYNTYDLKHLNSESKSLVNIPSSRFLRPYNEQLAIFESFKLRRIKKAMTYAAKNSQVFHLWWHPHNFGSHLESNIMNLTKVYEHYMLLNDKYGFQSCTMSEAARDIWTKK